MTTLFVEFGADLIVTPNGSIQLAQGWDEIRQRILRRILTTAQELLPDGTQTLPDYIFDVNYGIGAAKLVGQPITQSLVTALTNAITSGVTQDSAVVSNVLPKINIRRYGINTLYVTVQVFLVNGQIGTLAFTIQ